MAESPGAYQFQPGDNMLLIDGKDRLKLIVVPEAEDTVQIQNDRVTGADLCALYDGQVYTTPKSARYLVMRPTLEQAIMNMPRAAQLIYPKDLGTILMYGDIGPGMRVVEVGCGHGALTMTMLRALGPQGSLVSYDLRQDHLNRTRKNIAQYLGQSALETWTPILGNPCEEGFQQQAWDRLITDVPEPWDMVENAAHVLRDGGVWLTWLPTVTQVMRLVEAWNADHHFCMPRVFETLQRYWHIQPPSVRPVHDMKAHTGFVLLCRRRHIMERSAL